MGKVKGLRGKNTGIIIAHQFPMGKVKEWKEKYPDRVTEYQFPMGKVKEFVQGGGAFVYSINSLWER